MNKIKAEIVDLLDKVSKKKQELILDYLKRDVYPDYPPPLTQGKDEDDLDFIRRQEFWDGYAPALTHGKGLIDNLFKCDKRTDEELSKIFDL